MRFFLLFLFLVATQQVEAKSFASDWAHLKVPGWKISVSNERIAYAGKFSIGTVTFSRDNYSVKYFVFKLVAIDTTFRRKSQEWKFVQSCSYAGKMSFRSFKLNDYYYELEPCYKCNNFGDKRCEEMAANIQNYIEKKKWQARGKSIKVYVEIQI